MYKLFILILCFFSCNQEPTSNTIDLNKTQKIKVEKIWKSEHTISYLWSRPEGPENHNSSWIVNGNIMLFTPDKLGNYIITVSIQNSMGKILGEEKFHYTVIDDNHITEHPITNSDVNMGKIDKSKVVNQKKEKRKNTQIGGYTLQISSWDAFEDAQKNMSNLNGNGFNTYIEKTVINGKIWYRVRVGKNLPYNKCLKIKNKLEKMSIQNIWIDKYQ